MLANHIKIACRSLWRNRVFSVINLFGLALGITVFILITEYVAFEWSANRFNKNFNHIYRASTFGKENTAGSYYLAPGLAPAIKSTFPVVSKAVRIGEDIGNGVVSVPDQQGKVAADKVFREDKVSFVDEDFLSMFTFPVLQGNGRLNAPQTLALSQSTAKKFFGSGSAVGRVIALNNQFGNTTYTVNAVFTDMPEQSDIHADILLSFSTLDNPAFRNRNDWADPAGFGSGYTYQYFLLQNGADVQKFNAQATKLLHRLNPQAQTDAFALQPLSNLHLAPNFNYNFQTYGSLVLVVSFLSVAILILVIAWVNYVNLSTAQALNRAKEVGVRKVLGASRWQMMIQYITETFILMFAGLGVALLTVMMFQDKYNVFVDKQLSLALLTGSWFWIAGLLFIITCTFFAGGYVAALLSSFNPLKTIRGKATLNIGGVSLRKSLVVFQFVTSIVFIIATITLYRQLSYMQTQNLGMNLAQRLVVNGPAIVNSSKIDNSLSFENELSRLPFVKKYAASNNVPGQGYNFSTQGITRINPNPGDEKNSFSILIIDDKYFDTYDITLKDGTAFTPPMLEHGWPKTKKVILNESAARQLGFKDGERIIGQKLKWNGEFEVVGIVKDYHHLSLHETIRPMIFLPAVADGFFTIKMDGGNMSSKIDRIKAIYQKTFPGEPFTYSFIDEVFGKQYHTEQKLGSVFIAAAFTAIFIACLGLFGLAAFAARQKIKEIGIRKVLGAGVFNIIGLIARDFIKLVIIAFIIASPLAWYMMNKWLQNFAYRIEIQWWIFALAGSSAVLIAFVTISLQSVKAALADPVESLRNE